ncbi:MAG: hypothetical protein FJY76_01265 [Candidatus Aenigmarchaeota archaeon]|nr:hypothetical protein [Candidatus Aenigmarchaeota archaeon]
MQPIVTYDGMIARFPNMRPKSVELAKKLLPIYPSPELASVVAALMTDGHVDWYTGVGSPRTRKVVLYSSNKEECEWFIKTCKNIFGFEGKVIAYDPKYGFYRKQPYKAVISNACIAMILILCGAPAGDKTKKNFLIPDWIMNGYDEIKRQFLRAFFSFEASMPFRKSKRHHAFQMSLFMNKSSHLLQNSIDFFSQIIKLLECFGVACSRIASRPHSIGKNTTYFTITNQKSIVNFYRNIGFSSPDKQARLKSCILDISRFHRLKSGFVCELIQEMKNRIGTDFNLATCVNNFTENKYSKRQMEHFRRNEIAVPLEIISALIKIKNDETILEKMPYYVQTLLKLESSAHVPL